MLLLSKNNNKTSQTTVIETNHHNSFIALSIPTNYSIEEAKISRQDFYDKILQYPEFPHTLTDYIENRYYDYNNRIVRCTPLITTQAVDKNIVIKVAKLIEKEKSQYKKKYYTAYIFTLLKEGKIGTGYNEISLDEFVEFIKDYKVLSKGVVSKYEPSVQNDSTLKITDKNGELDMVRTKSANEYYQLFITRYNSLYAEYYDKEGISLAKLKEFL